MFVVKTENILITLFNMNSKFSRSYDRFTVQVKSFIKLLNLPYELGCVCKYVDGMGTKGQKDFDKQATYLLKDLRHSSLRAKKYDEARGIDTPRIWTAQRDLEMWDALQG